MRKLPQEEGGLEILDKGWKKGKQCWNGKKQMAVGVVKEKRVTNKLGNAKWFREKGGNKYA